jgi:hypothetical protein
MLDGGGLPNGMGLLRPVCVSRNRGDENLRTALRPVRLSSLRAHTAVIMRAPAAMNRAGLAALLGLVACSSSSPAQPGILALPPDLPARPTFVESDTCQAYLVPSGVSVGTSTPKDCQVQVTLANGEVLTSTASFKPLASGFILAGASPFQVSNTGAPQDASRVAGFGEWWYPECGTPANSCPKTCAPVQVVAAPAVCGPYETFMVGCVPGDLATDGWGCLMRRSTGEIIFTEEPPSNLADFEMCPPQIEGNAPRVPSTCPDASAP